MRVTEQLNHFLETRVLELKSVAENKKHINKTWLMLRLMELGQDWLAAYHLGQPTDYEEWLEKEMKKVARKIADDKKDLYLKGIHEGLTIAWKLFEQYEEEVCKLEE